MTAYYNEIDPYAAQWLRNLIDAGHIARGDVDERSIVDVRADDLRGYAQAHFFAGIGGWSVALRLAGWPDDRPVWTGSCPCQPFSAAGKGEAFNDERHLWPAWLPLIAECRPPIVFGEQVEAAVGWGWLDTVFADLEQEGYAVGAAVLPACSVGAPHIRQRLWFVADAYGGNARTEGLQRGGKHGQRAQDSRTGERLGDADRPGFEAREPQRSAASSRPERLKQSSSSGDVAYAAGGGLRELGNAPQPRSGRHADGGLELGALAHPLRERRRIGEPRHQDAADAPEPGEANLLADSERDGRRADEPQREAQGRAANGRPDPWACEWIACTDGKARPIEPGTFPLAHGIPARTSKLRAYGNAIEPHTGAEFIRACT